jgi:hypothetical protein
LSFKTGIKGLSLIIQKNETKKLREEIDNLHRIVGGMAVPLWQFGEKSLATSR